MFISVSIMIKHSYITFVLIIQSSVHSSFIRTVLTEAIWSYRTNSDNTFSCGNASDKFYKGPIQLDTELSVGVAKLVAALQAAASVAMAAQRMTAKQVAVSWLASRAVLPALVTEAFPEVMAEMKQKVAAWLASRAVLPAPVAVRLVRVLSALVSLATDGRMAAPAERVDWLVTTEAWPVRVARREVSLDLVGGREGFRRSLFRLAGVQPRFFASSVF
jgi:hypothetical protein